MKQKKRLKSTIFDLLACFFVFIHVFFDDRIFKLCTYKAKNGVLRAFSTIWKLCFWSTKYKKSRYAKSVPKWKVMFIHKTAYFRSKNREKSGNRKIKRHFWHDTQHTKTRNPLKILHFSRFMHRYSQYTLKKKV